MKAFDKETIIKAEQSAKLLTQDLRDAHSSACNSDNDLCLAILLMDALEASVKLEQRISLIRQSVNP